MGLAEKGRSCINPTTHLPNVRMWLIAEKILKSGMLECQWTGRTGKGDSIEI